MMSIAATGSSRSTTGRGGDTGRPGPPPNAVPRPVVLDGHSLQPFVADELTHFGAEQNVDIGVSLDRSAR